MNYQLYTHAIIVKTNINMDDFPNKYYQHIKDKKDLFILNFNDDTRRNGYVSHIKNIHMLAVDNHRISEGAVDFIFNNGYFTFFCANVSYVYQLKELFFSFDDQMQFQIIKYPLDEKLQAYADNLTSYIESNLNCSCIMNIEFNKFFGLTIVMESEKRNLPFKYFTNGLISFGMMNSQKQIEDIIQFIIGFDNYIGTEIIQ